MFKLLSGRNCFWGYHAKQNFLRRWFLSDAYECSEAWQNRLKSPAFTKIDFENVYHQMDLKFKQNKAVRVLDIDLFVNSLTDIQYVNEVEDILIKLRQNPECTLLPERTTHALLRLYLNNALKENLFMVLSNRMMFGVFPDYYLSNLMMNKFLKADDALSAAKVAVLLMLQEEWESPITKIFALYSCYAYLKSSQIWEIVESKIPEAEDEDEVRKVRVKFIRNPYFDDHFDLNVPNHLIGKTLWMFGLTLDEPIGVSSQLVGLVLYEKFEKCFVLLQDIIKQNTKLYSEAVVKAKDYIQNPPKQKVVEVSEENKNEQQKDEQVEAGSNKATDQWKNKVLELLEKLDNTNLKEGNMLNDLETKLKEVIEKNQGNDIEVQCKVSITNE